MENYLDFGSDTDSDGGRPEDFEMDSDEEDRREGAKLLKMLMTSSTNPVPKKVRNVDDFEAEMEAELDIRALEVESRGGVQHQKKSLSRSSSTSSLSRQSPSQSPCPSPKPGSSKRVRFSSSDSAPSAKKAPKISSTKPEARIKSLSKRTSSTESKSKKVKEYDGIYFDSDESDGENEEQKEVKKNRRVFKTDEDLFYDPDSDSRDQEWIDDQRRKDHNQNTKGSIPNALPNSDAVLNCPACFTVLCYDCQRHELYKSQYRAMFVSNCVISKDVTLRVPLKESKKKYWKRKSKETEQNEGNPGNLSAGDSFNPVKCKVCQTQVAVYDTEEVYHFFNVLASHA